MLKKGKEKVQEIASKKRSKVWNSFTEEQQPDGSKKVKCNNCGELLGGNYKNGTSHLKRHPCYRSTEPPKIDAKTAPPSNSYGNMENQGYVQPINKEPFGNREDQLGYVQQTNTEPTGCQDNNLGENHSGYVQPINKEPSGNRENQLEYVQQINTEPTGCQDNILGENHLGYVQPINTKPSGNRENPLRVCDFLSPSSFERMSEEIVAIGGARLTVEKMHCLINPTYNWIPDDIMNCYIKILNNQGSTSGKILKFSTFDTQQLQSLGSTIDGSDNTYECIEMGKCFLQNELVLLPIQVQSRWFVGVVSVPKKEFQILNSSNSLGRPYEETTRTLRLGIQKCIDIAALYCQGVPEEWMQENVLNWPIYVIPNLPQQNDGCSCGLFALKYMQLWDGSKLATEFTQDDIELFRKQLVGELIFSELNEMKDIQNDIKTRITGININKSSYH